MATGNNFLNESVKAITDNNLQKNLPGVLSKFELQRQASISQFYNNDLAKKRAAYAKWKVTENLDKYLVDFEASIIRKGGKVIWAYDKETALNEIEQLLKKNNFKQVAAANTMLHDEIGLDDFFKLKGINFFNADFSSFLYKNADVKPQHPIYKTILADRDQTIKKLNRAIKVSLEADDTEIALDIGSEIRNNVFGIDVAITGANFLIAENGMVVICDNEGSSALISAKAKCNLVIASIDSIIPTIQDIDLFLSLYASYSSGKNLLTYNLITGPKLNTEDDGPDEFIVLLLDNGRSDVLQTQQQREALYCIGCGACYNVCPVFNNTGHQPYGNAVAGPIGTVMKPLMNKELTDLYYASTSCGNCNNVCPVNIDIHNHIIRNRKEAEKSTGDKIAWYTWKKFALSRSNMNSNAGIKNFTFKQLFKKEWGLGREFPGTAEKSFNMLYREKNGLK